MNPVHILICSDHNEFIGVFAVIESIIVNTNHPERIHFHITVNDKELDLFSRQFHNLFNQYKFNIEIKEFPPNKFLEENICIKHHNTFFVNYISNIMNFSRFYLGELYPHLEKVIYLDTDVIVQGDIIELHDSILLDKHMFAAVPFMTFYQLGFYNQVLEFFPDLKLNHKTFNAGVYLTNLKEWTKQNILLQVQKIMLIHKNSKDPLFNLGTQPILNIIFNDKYYELPGCWNYINLGCISDLEKNEDFHKAKILHWSGLQKPWLPNGYYKNYWSKYDKLNNSAMTCIQKTEIWNETGNSYMLYIPEHSYLADNEANPTTSNLKLYENGIEMKSSHAIHNDIRSSGMGRYSHWKNHLYFSSSDNSSPVHNDKKYSYLIQ
ncbi:MAG: putative galacturonosyltransferase 6-like protein [Hyperionvirus sp.]|uniref:Putative galacturonosyltransferase 6-like protein n=1 Tax=Hyperionvirus sp. TaxID=2487770 RepID=A0A3G5ADE5_9VIRU|nr:MAG: putative galacturonosyltransferase 6-like protein [Hyperionvirus sp.]